MKPKILTALIILLLTLPQIGLTQMIMQNWTITLAYNPNMEVDLAGYRLYHSMESFAGTVPYGDHAAEIPVGTEIYDYLTTAPGTHYFLLTAFDTTGNESGPSNEVSHTVDDVAPANPGGLNITINLTINIGG